MCAYFCLLNFISKLIIVDIVDLDWTLIRSDRRGELAVAVLPDVDGEVAVAGQLTDITSDFVVAFVGGFQLVEAQDALYGNGLTVIVETGPAVVVVGIILHAREEDLVVEL